MCISAVVTSCYGDGDFELSNYMYMEGQDSSFVYSFEARVDYCFNQTLHGVCDVGWSNEDAAVACRRNGEGYCESTKIKSTNISMVFVNIAVSEAITGLPYGPRVPVIDNVMCNGSEYMLDQCQTSEPGQISQACTESSTRAAGVRCYQGWQYEPFRCYIL